MAIAGTICFVLLSNAIYQIFSLHHVFSSPDIYQIKSISPETSYTQFDGIRAIIQMDKEVYRPGESAHIRVVLLHGENGTLLRDEPRSHNIAVNVISPRKKSVALPSRHYKSGVYSAVYYTGEMCNLHILSS